MIDFKKNRFSHNTIGEEDKEVLKLRSADIHKDLEDVKTNFFYLGAHLIDLYNSGSYCVYAKEVTPEQMRIDYNLPVGAGNLCSDYFFAYCEKVFALEKSQVSRLMNIADEFGTKRADLRRSGKTINIRNCASYSPLPKNNAKQ